MNGTIIAVDFDGTLCRNEWPEIGPENWSAIQELQRRKAQGDRIILWTCRDGKLLDAAIQWCAARALTFDAVNANLPENIDRYGGDCRKVFAHEYWDDRAVRPSGASPACDDAKLIRAGALLDAIEACIASLTFKKRENAQAAADTLNGILDAIRNAPAAEAIPAETVRRMRDAQKQYFRTRDLADLRESKQLEKEIDELTAERPISLFD